MKFESERVPIMEEAKEAIKQVRAIQNVFRIIARQKPIIVNSVFKFFFYLQVYSILASVRRQQLCTNCKTLQKF